MNRLMSAFAVVLAGCSSSDPAPFTCAMGELRGTWRAVYMQTNGNCGKVADETIVLSASTAGEASQCTYAAQQVSADKCRIDLDYTCPLTGQPGTQRWVGAMHHAAAGTVTGSMTVSAAGSATCRSTYDVTWTKQ